MENDEISNRRVGCMALLLGGFLAPFAIAFWLYGLGLCGGAWWFMWRSWVGA
jgi:hypothetical protein